MLSDYSNMGGALDFRAPGAVVSTYPPGVPYPPSGRPGSPYETMKGTSISCPLVAAIAARLIQAGRDRPDTMSAGMATRAEAQNP